MQVKQVVKSPLRKLDATTVAAQQTVAIPYEKQLDRDSRWALSEASLFFEGKGAVQEALRKVTARLHELGIPYTVVGGLALFQHGYRRFTDDVDLLVTKENLKIVHEKLEGLGYLPPFTHSKNLRDTELGVKIEFLITGEFPGDGKPKPVAFPDPISSSINVDGVQYLNLNALVELKLASGMTNPGRVKDLGDVTELIKVINLPLDFAEKLNSYVQDKFREIWRNARRRFRMLWPNNIAAAGRAKSIEEMIDGLRQAADTLEAMKKDGVVFDPAEPGSNDFSYLFTSDPEVAEKYGMQDEAEFWPDDRTRQDNGES